MNRNPQSEQRSEPGGVTPLRQLPYSYYLQRNNDFSVRRLVLVAGKYAGKKLFFWLKPVLVPVGAAMVAVFCILQISFVPHTLQANLSERSECKGDDCSRELLASVERHQESALGVQAIACEMCGNGIVNSALGEVCDDGNTSDQDRYSANFDRGRGSDGPITHGLGTPEFATWFNQNPGMADMVMHYIVRCAVPAGSSRTWTNPTTGVQYTWIGDLGLAPSWAGGVPATEVEQQVVTACLCSHTNRFGVRGPSSILGLDFCGLRNEGICGDGICQVSESCGTGFTPDNCRDCGPCD